MNFPRDLPEQAREPVRRELSALWPGDDAPLPALWPLLRPRVHPGREPSEGVLVAAALLGHAPALARLDGLLRAEAARQARLRHVDEAELAQAVRTRLLGPDGRLSTWDGRGAFAAWLRVVTTRVALNLRRDAGREEPVAELPDREASAAGPELQALRTQYAAHFKAAFAQAIAQLSPRDRALLRLHTVQGLSLSRLGTMYRRDTSTLSRWLDQARAALATGTRAALQARLDVSEAELLSLARVAEFEFSTSLSRWLQSTSAA